MGKITDLGTRGFFDYGDKNTGEIKVHTFTVHRIHDVSLDSEEGDGAKS